MRTTLTLDDDLALRLKELSRESGRSFKEVANDALRRGLSTGAAPADEPSPFVVVPSACGFKTGVDPLELNQLYDDLESGRLGAQGVHEP